MAVAITRTKATMRINGRSSAFFDSGVSVSTVFFCSIQRAKPSNETKRTETNRNVQVQWYVRLCNQLWWLNDVILTRLEFTFSLYATFHTRIYSFWSLFAVCIQMCALTMLIVEKSHIHRWWDRQTLDAHTHTHTHTPNTKTQLEPVQLRFFSSHSDMLNVKQNQQPHHVSLRSQINANKLICVFVIRFVIPIFVWLIQFNFTPHSTPTALIILPSTDPELKPTNTYSVLDAYFVLWHW